MADQGAPTQPSVDLLKLEYQECMTSVRFIVGIRFTFFVSFMTFFFVLVGAYQYILASEAVRFGALKPWLLLTTAIFGLLTSAAGWIIEMRNINIYRTTDIRSAILERMMGIRNGIRQMSVGSERRPYFWKLPMTHTVAIMSLYIATMTTWVALFIYGGYRILPH